MGATPAGHPSDGTTGGPAGGRGFQEAARTAEVAGASRQPPRPPTTDRPSRTFKELKLQNPKKDGETQGKYRQRLALLMRGDGPKRQAPPVQGGARKVILEGEGSRDQAANQKTAAPWAAPRR